MTSRQWPLICLQHLLQLFIDVDCSNLTYTSRVSPSVQAAADSIEQQRRGWTTEEDKKEKILNLPQVKSAIRPFMGSDSGLSIINMYYDRLGFCSFSVLSCR